MWTGAKENLHQNSKTVGKVGVVLNDPYLRTAVDTAFLEYTRRQAKLAQDAPLAVAHRIEGATQFIEVLLAISDLAQKPTYRDPDNLPNT